MSESGIDDHFHPGEAAPDPSDPPLADDLEAFINGAQPGDLSQNFTAWIEALARVKVQECYDIRDNCVVDSLVPKQHVTCESCHVSESAPWCEIWIWHLVW